MKRLLILFLMAAAVATAQESDRQWMLDDLRACYDGSDTSAGKMECTFVVSSACQESEDGGYSTLGISSCNADEAAAWDVLLNEEYRATMTEFETYDAEDAKYSSGLASRVDTLRDAQRAWIVFRDAECLNEYALWGSGSMRNIIGSACILNETAERTIELWAKREAY